MCCPVPSAVCAATGDHSQAFAVFNKAKAAQQQLQQEAAAAGKAAEQQLDGHIYGALIAACAQGIKARSSDRKDQLVILDRAFQVLQDAMDSGIHLETPVWNGLLMCAGQSAASHAHIRTHAKACQNICKQVTSLSLSCAGSKHGVS